MCFFVPFVALFVAENFSRGCSNTWPPSATSSFGMKNCSQEKIMYRTKINRIVLAIIALLTLSVAPAFAFDNENGPELPEQCSSIKVEEGNKLAFHAYAKGVQIYKWNIVTQTWDLVAPQAGLFAEEGYHGEIGTHYIGPKWESKSGSLVEARRVPGTGCTPDPTAIAWILLKQIRVEGSGLFSKVTFIQRVNTVGGLAPSTQGEFDGQIKESPYTAEYYFYSGENPSSN
jgi:Protein of unknown function (DUF3455)